MKLKKIKDYRIMQIDKYNNFSKKELIDEITKLKKRKKFGLVWEDKKEKVIEDCKNNFPILDEIKKKERNFRR